MWDFVHSDLLSICCNSLKLCQAINSSLLLSGENSHLTEDSYILLWWMPQVLKGCPTEIRGKIKEGAPNREILSRVLKGEQSPGLVLISLKHVGCLQREALGRELNMNYL